ncbi:MAG: transcription elongation factor GreA [Chloroflexi bacterium]|nr:transcription elongation factor GreA [Chloroflexota bacterium]
MLQKEFMVTPEGLAKLEAELDDLRTARRQEVAERIQRAKEMGGTENNAEYDDAKDEQAFVEGRILTLESMLKQATVIPAEHQHGGTVNVGCTVTVRTQDSQSEKYTIVGRAEANPAQGKISNESPVGRALLGKKVGDQVSVAVPAGTIKMRILEIR